MKKLTILWVNRGDFQDPKTYDMLVSIYPEGDEQSRFFRAELRNESPTLKAIHDLLAASGLKPWLDDTRGPRPDEYRIEKTIKFEKRDFLKARYLTWFPNHSLMDVTQTNEAGRILVNTDSFEMAEVEGRTKKALFSGNLHMAVEGTETLISDPFRKIIEAAKLIGLQYEDGVEFIGPQASKVPHKYWILRTDKVMPPVSKQTVWVDKDKQPCEDHNAPGSHIAIGELYRYDKAAIQAMGEFDAAIQFESSPKNPNWIMSQRFYQLCLQHKVPLYPEPVEVV